MSGVYSQADQRTNNFQTGNECLQPFLQGCYGAYAGKIMDVAVLMPHIGLWTAVLKLRVWILTVAIMPEVTIFGREVDAELAQSYQLTLALVSFLRKVHSC